MPEGIQDKRLRNPKLEKRKERKLKIKEKKSKTKKWNFIVNIEDSVGEPWVPNLLGVQPSQCCFFNLDGIHLNSDQKMMISRVTLEVRTFNLLWFHWNPLFLLELLSSAWKNRLNETTKGSKFLLQSNKRHHHFFSPSFSETIKKKKRFPPETCTKIKIAEVFFFFLHLNFDFRGQKRRFEFENHFAKLIFYSLFMQWPISISRLLCYTKSFLKT